MLEIADGVQDFAKEASRLGFEYLGEFESELEPDDHFFNRNTPARNLPEKIYVALPTAASLRELLSLWTTYQSGNRLPKGMSSWARLFDLLVEIRPWGPKDRLPKDSKDILTSQLELAGDSLKLELEFWHSNDPQMRARFSSSIRAEVVGLGGEIIDESIISDIKYHGILIRLQSEVVRDMVEHETSSLLKRDELMFIRPQTMSLSDQEGYEIEDLEERGLVPRDLGEPICAILDGMPIQRHSLLSDWLELDDPDDIDGMSIVEGRGHGTSMASLVIHGDLNSGDLPITRKVYLRPVMFSPDGHQERTLENTLIIDLVYRAVKRIKEGDQDGGPAAPEVFIINLSLGDQNRPFTGPLSPWARLIDHLSFKYNLLFIVSAGNITTPLPIPGFDRWIDFEDEDPRERHKKVLLALNSQKAFRTVLSPAESVNAITVGARNYASLPTDYVPGGMHVALNDVDAPNISSAVGLGYRGSVKPDFLMPGGRELVGFANNRDGLAIRPLRGTPFSGAKVAAPSGEGDLEKVAYSTGTSVAAALTSHLAHKVHLSLMDREGGSQHSDIPSRFYPVVVKALLAHTARWPSLTQELDAEMEPRGAGTHIARKSNLTRIWGYGSVNESTALECAENRATLIGYGEIGADDANLYKIPLPTSLNGKVAFRSMTVTIAWLAPTNPNHAMYKRATIDIDNGNGRKDFGFDLQRSDQPQPNHFVSGKSTILQERFSGERAVAIANDDEIHLRIFCKAQAGELFTTVPYAIVVSFEVASNSNIDVYTEIRQKLAVGVRQ